MGILCIAIEASLYLSLHTQSISEVPEKIEHFDVLN